MKHLILTAVLVSSLSTSLVATESGKSETKLNPEPIRVGMTTEAMSLLGEAITKKIVLYSAGLYAAKLGAEALYKYIRTHHTQAGRHEAVRADLQKLRSIVELQLPIMRTIQKGKTRNPLSEESINEAIKRDLGFCMEMNLTIKKSESIVNSIINDINTSAKGIDDLALLNACHKTKSELDSLKQSVTRAAVQIKSLKS